MWPLMYVFMVAIMAVIFACWHQRGQGFEQLRKFLVKNIKLRLEFSSWQILQIVYRDSCMIPTKLSTP